MAWHHLDLADFLLIAEAVLAIPYDKALIKACASAEVPRVSSHSLRHTYVSWMIDEGHSADKVAFWIGDTPDTVRSVYAHMLEESSAPGRRQHR